MIIEWMEEALCSSMPVNFFFDDYLNDDDIAIKVNELCKSCPVQVECLNFGLDTKSTGIWGGRWLQGGKIIKQKEIMFSNYFSEE